MAPRIGIDPVIVAGAGIGGLATALFLARKGIPVVVLEKRVAFAEIGAGLQMSPNASHLLLDLGLGPALMRVATIPRRVVARGMESGRPLGGVELGDFLAERHEAPYLVLRRADLHQILLDAARTFPNIAFGIGRGVTHVAELADGVIVTATTAGGAVEDATAPCLVGADGLWSVTRAALGDRRQPVFSRTEAWRATLPAEAAPDFARASADGSADTGLWLGQGRHVVHYPVDAGRAVNVVAVMEARLPRDGWSNAADSAPLLARFSDAARPLRELLAAVTDWQVWSLHDLPARQVAGRRIALVGDAAHPVLPFLAQGAALAIEDAATLGELLETLPDDVPTALSAYKRLRLKRAQRVQDAARRVGRFYHAWGPVALARDLAMAFKGPRGIARDYDWLYGWRLTID